MQLLLKSLADHPILIDSMKITLAGTTFPSNLLYIKLLAILSENSYNVDYLSHCTNVEFFLFFVLQNRSVHLRKENHITIASVYEKAILPPICKANSSLKIS